MIRLSTLTGRLVAGAMLASALLLTGCHRGDVKAEVAAIQAKQHFDMVIQAYKSGQFMLEDGAVLSAIDTGSHFAYLKDVGKLPKTVLLTPSDDSKVRKQHLEYMARIALDYGVVVYYDDGGQLKQINPQETKARALEDYHAPLKLNDEQKRKSAAGSSMGDPSSGY